MRNPRNSSGRRGVQQRSQQRCADDTTPIAAYHWAWFSLLGHQRETPVRHAGTWLQPAHRIGRRTRSTSFSAKARSAGLVGVDELRQGLPGWQGRAVRTPARRSRSAITADRHPPCGPHGRSLGGSSVFSTMSRTTSLARRPVALLGLALLALGSVVGGTYSEAHFGSCSRPASENYASDTGRSSVELVPPHVVCTYSSRPRTTRHFAGFGIAWVAAIAVSCEVAIDALRRRRAGARAESTGDSRAPAATQVPTSHRT